MGRQRQQRKARQRKRLTESAVAAPPAPADGLHELKERGTTGKLQEGTGAKRRVTIIEAGWGSSGYYSEAVLRRDGPKAFGPGTHMYIDHPSASEEADRPERSLTTLAGVITSVPVMEGKALVAEAAVYEHWQPVINAMAGDIGVSIRAMGGYEFGEAEGREGNIITSLEEGLSVDYVTVAGAGGKVGELLESARRAALEEARNAGQWFEAAIHRDFTLTADGLFGNGYLTREERLALSSAIGEALDAFTAKLKEAAPGLYERDPYADLSQPEASVNESKAVEETARTSDQEDIMSDEAKDQLADLRETVNTLEKQVEDLTSKLNEATQGKERAEDALLRVQAERVVEEAKDGDDSIYEGLPSRAVDRVKESALKGDLPLTEDGKLHQEHLEERARKAAADEREYLGEAGVKQPKVTGFGESAEPGTSQDEGTGKLQESFQRIGLGEKAAQVAAGGR